MKLTLICIIAAVLVVSGSVAQEQSDCPSICPALWAPLCGRNSKGEELTFDNECAMRAKNCLGTTKNDYTKQRSGNC